MDKEPTTRKEAIERNLTRYFSGKPCKNGHISERALNRKCLECVKVWNKESYLKDVEKIRESAKIRAKARYYQQKDKCLSINKKWAENNPDKVRAYREKSYALNKSRYLESNAKWRAEHPEEMKIYKEKWKTENPEKVRAVRQNRRAKVVNSQGKHTAEQIKQLLIYQRFKCANKWCNCDFNNDYQIDHIMPLKLGGSNDIFNIQLLCKLCNMRKGAKDPIQFAQENGMLL